MTSRTAVAQIEGCFYTVAVVTPKYRITVS